MIDEPTYPTKIKPLKMTSTATTGFQGTRISIASPPGIESSLRLTNILTPNWQSHCIAMRWITTPQKAAKGVPFGNL
jgi:hypothetical protein